MPLHPRDNGLARNREITYNYLPASVCEFPLGDPLSRQVRDAGLCEMYLHGFHVGERHPLRGTRLRYVEHWTLFVYVQ
jgi:hypothetical protein